MLTPSSFFDLTLFEHKELFADAAYVWDGLQHLKSYMDSKKYSREFFSFTPNEPFTKTVVLYDNTAMSAEGLTINFGDATKGKLKVYKGSAQLEGASVIMAGALFTGDKILIGKGVLVESGAFIQSPAIIGDQTVVRQGAYMRGYCLIGKKCVVGHVTEVKHTIFFDGAKAGHFAYLGDSILGNEVNLGAGTKLANLRFMSGNVQVKTPNDLIDTGLRKFGAILADHVQTGCNAVTSPGTILGKQSMLLPNVTAPSGLHRNHSFIR